MGEGRIAHLKKILVQGQDGYSHGVKTQEGNRCVPVEPNTNLQPAVILPPQEKSVTLGIT